MSKQNSPSTPISSDATDESLTLEFLNDVEVLPAPRERSFWEMLLGWPNTSSAQLEEAQQMALLDKYRASLTYSTIQHVMAYSSMERQLSGISPRGAARIGSLIDAYTVQAIKAIQGR